MRKNEFSRLDIKFLGRFFHPNGKEVGRTYSVENLVELLELEIAAVRKFEDSWIELSSSSKKYQKVGVQSIKRVADSGNIFYHFEVGFIFRDQETLETYDFDLSTIEELVIDGKKYRHVRLHFSILPNENIIILDNKCHSTPVCFLLKDLLSKHIDATKYNSLATEASQNLRVKITPIPKTDFEQLLNQKFRQLKEFSFTFAKPGKLKMSQVLKDEDIDIEKENSIFAELVESVMEKTMSLNKNQIVLESLPIKSFRFTVAFDDKAADAELRTAMKTKTKEFLKNHQDSLYTDEASFKYKGAEGEIEQALLNSAKLTAECEVKAKNFNDCDKMWKQQRVSFKTLKNQGKFEA